MIYNNGAWKVGEAGGVIRGNFFIPKLKEVLLEKPPHCFTVKVQTSGRFFYYFHAYINKDGKLMYFSETGLHDQLLKKLLIL